MHHREIEALSAVGRAQQAERVAEADGVVYDGRRRFLIDCLIDAVGADRKLREEVVATDPQREEE